MSFAVKRYPQIMSDMLSWIVANQDKITDFNEGSIISSYCEAIGIELEEFYIKARLGFDKYLLNIPYNAFDFSELAGTSASGNETFTRSGTSGDLPIPEGTIISTGAGILFQTTADGEISDGNSTSSPIPIIAVEVGSDGNVPAATITTLVTSINDIVSITNPTATTNGVNGETEAEFKERFQEFIEGLGGSNISGLKAAAKTVSGVRSASAVEHFPPVSTYNVTIYIDDGSGEATAEMIADVEDILIGDGTLTNPGQKGGGINLRVLAPTKVTIDVTVELTDDGTLSEEAIEYNVTSALTTYINGLEIGDDVILNKIISTIMEEIGIIDCTVTEPSSNITISDTQIARIGDIVITFA